MTGTSQVTPRRSTLPAQKGCPGNVSLRDLPSLPAAVDRVQRPSPESQNNSLWVIVGVVIPVLVVMAIVIILYWKLCRTDKLDFQPDAVANIQQRQKVRGKSPAAKHTSRRQGWGSSGSRYRKRAVRGIFWR